jgi:PAS domain S-box-containing protein
MPERQDDRRWLWITLVLSSVSIVAVVFAFWELVENQFFRDLDYVSLHYLYISRSIASSLLLAIWAAWYVLHYRRQAEEELRRSRERYRGLLELSPAAVVLYDRDMIVVEWNKAAERLYGVDRDDVIGRPLPSVAPADRIELAERMAQVESGKTVLDYETTRRDLADQPFEVQLSLLPFVEGNRTLFLEVTQDIRERVRLRQALLQLEKLSTMGKMAAGTAHHLNTPLASALLRLEMMQDLCPKPDCVGAGVSSAQLARSAADEGPLAKACAVKMHDHLSHMNSSLGFCQQFVRRLLDFARPPRSIRQPEEMSGVVEAVVGFLSPSVTSRQIALHTGIEALRNTRVLGDRNQLETLLLILMSNALDALPPGGTLRIAATGGPQSVTISVSDNGCGIREQDLAHVFEPFFTTKPAGKGTGLGLPIAQGIVTEHGGAIAIESTVGSGTTVRVQLPVHQPVVDEVLV